MTPADSTVIGENNIPVCFESFELDKFHKPCVHSPAHTDKQTHTCSHTHTLLHSYSMRKTNRHCWMSGLAAPLGWVCVTSCFRCISYSEYTVPRLKWQPCLCPLANYASLPTILALICGGGHGQAAWKCAVVINADAKGWNFRREVWMAVTILCSCREAQSKFLVHKYITNRMN